MTVVYQSRFLRFWRVQIHRWQHHWQIQQRRWQTSLKWTVQAWVYPLYRLVQVNQWLPQGIKQGIKKQWQTLQAQTEPPPPPACDTPIVNVLQSLELPGLALSHPEAAPSLILHPPQPRTKPIFQLAWHYLSALGIMARKSLTAWWTPKQSPQLSGIPDPLALEPAPSSEPSPDRPERKPVIPFQAWWQWLGAKSRNIGSQALAPSNHPENSALTTLTASLELIPTEPSGQLMATAPKASWAWAKTITDQVTQTGLTLWQKREQITHPLQALTRTIKLALGNDSTALQPRDALGLETSASSSTAGLEPQTLQIQGIACYLPNRHLVLVGANNQIFDSLTGAQQKQLAERILWELAGYYYQLRQWQHLTGQSLARWGLRTPSDFSLNPASAPQLRPSWQPLSLPAGLGITLSGLWSQCQAWLFSGPTPALSPHVSARQPAPALAQQPSLTIQPASNSPLQLIKTSPARFTTTDPFTLDIDSTFLGYEPQGLEVIWLWLDRFFLWLERAWAWVWGLRPKLGNLG